MKDEKKHKPFHKFLFSPAILLSTVNIKMI